MPFKLGRNPRSYNPRVPHYSALGAGRKRLIAPPSAVDYTVGMPSDFGQMLNDDLGDCTCAAFYHALQVWSYNAAAMVNTEPDSYVLQMYEQACGYNPSDPSTDQGGVEQEVLSYLLNTGAPTSAGPHKLAAFVEVDPTKEDDIKEIINDCGVLYIGMSVPEYIFSADDPPGVWDIQYKDTQSAGGHAVACAGYNDYSVAFISWGKVYRMTWSFFQQYVDEAYALADAFWIKQMGTSPVGMSLPDLEAQMSAIANQWTEPAQG
jgi:hypothetical protein